VVIDSYSISREVIASLEASGARVVLIDDNGEHSGFPSSVIVNPNPHGRTIDYRSVAGQRVFTGAEWILIRPDVLAASSDRSSPATGWVIAIGGTDPGGLVEQVRRLLPVNESVVVAPTPVGPLPPSELSGALSRARGAVIAAGSTAWEALFLATPTVVVVTADNQELVGRSLRDDFGVDVVDARVEGWEEFLACAITGLGQSEPPVRPQIDGRGAERLSGVIRELLEGRDLAVE
jgi:spore coat polysaccharide biosynthesis predicted glycosyltransferase SpsG